MGKAEGVRKGNILNAIGANIFDITQDTIQMYAIRFLQIHYYYA